MHRRPDPLNQLVVSYPEHAAIRSRLWIWRTTETRNPLASVALTK
jgi:hypothetical protein